MQIFIAISSEESKYKKKYNMHLIINMISLNMQRVKPK